MSYFHAGIISGSPIKGIKFFNYHECRWYGLQFSIQIKNSFVLKIDTLESPFGHDGHTLCLAVPINKIAEINSPQIHLRNLIIAGYKW